MPETGIHPEEKCYLVIGLIIYWTTGEKKSFLHSKDQISLLDHNFVNELFLNIFLVHHFLNCPNLQHINFMVKMTFQQQE